MSTGLPPPRRPDDLPPAQQPQQVISFQSVSHFMEFLLGPYSQKSLDLRFAQSPPEGTLVSLVLQVPDLTEALQLSAQVRQRIDAQRARLSLEANAPLQTWLGGFVRAWQLSQREAAAASEKAALRPRAGAHTGPLPTQHTGPLPMQHSGPLPTQHSGPLPTQHTGPFPTQHTGPLPTQHTGPLPTQHTGPLPTQHTGPLPTQHTGPLPTRQTGPLTGSHPIKRSPQALLKKLDELTYYEIFEIPFKSDLQQIQRAYHGLTRIYHPDLFFGAQERSQHAATHIYQRINEAYGVLTDERRRRLYDEGLEGAEGPRQLWPLRLSEDDETQRQRLAEHSARDRGAHYWQKALESLKVSGDAGQRDHTAQAVRALRLAMLFEPEQEKYTQLLNEVVSGRYAQKQHQARRR